MLFCLQRSPSELRVCSLGGRLEALWALWDWAPSRAAERNKLSRAALRRLGCRTQLYSARCRFCRVRGCGYAHTFPESHEPSLRRLSSHTLLLPPSPHHSRILRLAAPPHTRGCLFLLGLSMLSLFKRLCHRLDAGNKVRRCV